MIFINFIFITLTLFASNNIIAGNSKIPIIIEQNTTAEIITINGSVHSYTNGSAIKNAKIRFITLEKVIVTSTDNEGHFELEIPKNIIKKSNLLQIDYRGLKHINYESEQLVVSEDEINSPINIQAHLKKSTNTIILHHGKSYERQEPLFYINGKKVSIDHFRKKVTKRRLKKKYNLYHIGLEGINEVLGVETNFGIFLILDKEK
jgi:hypothetical protein